MLVADHLSYTYPNGVEALRDFSLHVRRGEFVTIVGPSGCGKSTLLRILAGLIQPTQGHAQLNGEMITQPTSRVGFMFQDAALLPWRTVEQNVRLPLELGDKETRDWRLETATASNLQSLVSSLVQLVDLAGFEHAYPRELSGGMKQRVALARALITQPPVLLLDEPFGALDAMTRESLTAALERILQTTGTTAMMVTHNIVEAVFLADQVVVISPRPGRVVGAVPVTLPRPRSWAMEGRAEFGETVTAVRVLLSPNMCVSNASESERSLNSTL